jgi:hypothetical protein
MVDEKVPRATKPHEGSDNCDCGAPHRDGDTLRCECGNLLARYLGGRVELKSRRCKRTVMLPTVDTLEGRGLG